MSTSAAAKKGSRATNEQLTQMVDFMLANPGLAGGKFQKLHGKAETNETKWWELSEILNSLGGALKTVDQWQTVWRDLKSRTSIKVRDRRKQLALTGNRPVNQEPITELERRVVALIGSNYIEGHNSVCENVPLKEEHQLHLEDGEDIILQMSSSPSSSGKCCTTPSVLKSTPRRGVKRKRVEDGDTQSKFLEIAKQQADALKMLAEASAQNVEANKLMAEAIKTMGEGLKATAEAFQKLANALTKD